MLTINVLTIEPQFVCNFIQKAKEFHAKESVTFSEETPNSEYEYDWSQVLADHQDDLTYLEIKDTVSALTANQKVDLLALMYLGRGDFDEAEWDDARLEASNNVSANLTNYILGHPYIADYLETALEKLDYSCEE